MSRPTLLTSIDVLRFSGFSEKINFCNLQQLHQIEYREARKCLGLSFYNRMIAALVDDSETVKYEPGKTYNAGDRAVWNRNVIRQATNETSNTPDLSTDWKDGDKFTGDCASFYDEVYCYFLGPYLAHTVAANRLPYIYTTVTNTGVLEYNGNNYDTVDEAVYDRLLGAIHRDRNNSYNNLVDFLTETYKEAKENDENNVIGNDCLSGWIGIKEIDKACGCGLKNCKTCGNGRRVSRRTRVA